MTAKWTNKPEELTNGAYWYQMPGTNPDILWIYDGKVFGVIHSPSWNTVKHHLVPGAMFYGPLDLPPPMPIEENLNQWSDCA